VLTFSEYRPQMCQHSRRLARLGAAWIPTRTSSTGCIIVPVPSCRTMAACSPPTTFSTASARA
jgi:hypothetical protein